MDYMLDREAMAVGEVIFDGCQEQPVDLNISLPDYCPDIQRILKCQIYPKIGSRSISGDRLMLEGGFTVKVFYLDPGGMRIRFCDSTDTFSSEISLKQAAENAQIYAFPRVEYINCRATSPRRLDIHGAFSVCAKVVVQGHSDVVSNIVGSDVEQQKKTMKINNLVGFCQQQFSVDEILELGSGKPPADSIMRTDAFAVLQDFKVTAGKLMVKGEACVKFLYDGTEENSMPEAMEFTIPFSQMLDCASVTDDCLCDVKLSVIGVEAQIKNDYSGDKTFFDTQIRLFASAAAYQGSEVTVVNDAYSKDFDMNIESKQKTVDNLAELVGDTTVHKSTLSVEDNTVSRVIDVWNEMSTVSAEIQGGQITFKGKYSLCVLALDEESKPFYFERLLDFEYTRACSSSGDNTKCEAQIAVGGISFRIMGSGIEAKTELRLTAEIFSRYSFKAITDVTADEEKPVARDNSAALCIYYAEAGENLWNIARDYRTSMTTIKQENGIAGDVMENRGMLLIPM
ncbi:hypothetical protein CAFE_36560 [Caprobacter fermentans]|uniref:LysM domain-containing protein n=1 Tax=Caproicibacter fermentans TaxID=2576756 RepID=A0A6N8I4L9_9FIRM|nr:SPOCS domain-containing protein [Caproicibacter fermentans]MVB12909.1 hypothetical protein [Caproicibacter fermentans]OCN02388.1 hypothetical protein A7X67_14805 [Clostridium sp. W14A]